MVVRRLVLLVVAASVVAANAAAPANATVPVAPVAPVVAAQAQPAVLTPVTPNVKAAVALVQPQIQLPNPLLPAQTLAQYKNTLKRIVAFKRWKMAYYYIYSTRFSAYVSTMQEDDKLSEDMKKAKAFMAKAAIFFDILANYEITGFIYCVLLLTWASPPPTDYMGAVAYYQSLKCVYAFFTWQYFLIWKDYMALFPDAYAKVDSKVKSFVDIAETFSCFYAFNEWHVSKMMDIATLTDPTSKMTQAKLASFYWDETFITTVKTLMYFTLWSWSYPDQKWLTTSKPFIALSLPWIAFTESYWETTIANIESAALAQNVQASKVQVQQ